MNIWKHLEHDHAELHSLASDILKASDGGDVGGRDNQFDLYDLQLRRHLALVEEVLLPPLGKEERLPGSCTDIKARHKELRRGLSALDRSGKGSPEWTAEFRDFVDLFDRRRRPARGARQAGQAELRRRLCGRPRRAI